MIELHRPQIYVLHFGDWQSYVRPRFEDAAAPFIGVLIQVQTQAFLLHRAWCYATVARVAPAVKITVASVLGACIVASAACGLGVALQIKVTSK